MFRTSMLVIGIGTALMLAPLPAVAQARIEGSWMFTLESPEGTFNIPLAIAREENRLVARIPTGAVFFTGVENERGVEFHWDLDYQGLALATTLVGTFQNGEWVGTADFGGAASGTWVARAAAPPGGAPPASAPQGG